MTIPKPIALLNVTAGLFAAYVLYLLASLHFLFVPSERSLSVLFSALRTGSFNAFLLLMVLSVINWVLFRAVGHQDAEPSSLMLALTSARIAFLGALLGGVQA
ncbi:MAG: hypothetical protein ACRENP_04155 [Longimicrobiales bacterium]